MGCPPDGHPARARAVVDRRVLPHRGEPASDERPWRLEPGDRHGPYHRWFHHCDQVALAARLHPCHLSPLGTTPVDNLGQAVSQPTRNITRTPISANIATHARPLNSARCSFGAWANANANAAPVANPPRWARQSMPVTTKPKTTLMARITSTAVTSRP